MKTLLGIPIHINYDRIPEEEYLTLIRKRVNTPKRKAFFHMVMGALVAILAVQLIGLFFSLREEDFGLSLGKGFSIGAMLGLFFGMGFLFAAVSLFTGTTAWRGNRTEKLLLKYYEQANKKT
jgi:hypothetical protein